jgi:mannose PTS system EIIA component
MIGVIVATHGDFGRALLSTLQMILGQPEGMAAVTLSQEDSLESFKAKLEKALGEVDPKGEGTLVMVDMLGGTPFNVALQLAQDRKLVVITGLSLPMLVKAASHQEGKDLKGLALDIQNSAREGVVTSVELFKK